ncbi:Yip1 family protein [Pedomonas mirosovicensis]|uniref:Yip1 family protein n=1 Tax=Pedomonas mirosovicensis TaxID=2908641 RepID=UPI002168C806|nr:Yip1 family protein [Pedomonas mirosovicensis]MCH8686305.1 YIP1 family protein [Pedomonas mirosovicensis]
METGSAHSTTDAGLVSRAKSLLLRPDPEWDRIDLEPTTIRQIYRAHVIPLAAIPAIAGFLGSVVFGFSALGMTYHPSVGSALIIAVVHYLLTLIGVYAMALIIDGLAPTFHGTRNRVQAFKVAAYSATAGWVSGIFLLLPPLSILSVLGFYSLYLLYVGLPPLMKVQREKARVYIVVTAIAGMVVWYIIVALTMPVAGLLGAHRSMGTLTVAGVGTVDMDELAEPAKRAEAVFEELAEAPAPADRDDAAPEMPAALPFGPARLEAFLPSTFAGLERTEMQTASGTEQGLGSFASARYENDDSSASVKITDMAGMGGLAALGSALNVVSSRTTETGYERIGKVDGRLTTERWNQADRSGHYSVIVANRFVIEAEANGINMNDLKKVISRIDLGALEQLASNQK